MLLRGGDTSRCLLQEDLGKAEDTVSGLAHLLEITPFAQLHISAGRRAGRAEGNMHGFQ